ncbi:hypothetical protein HQ560_18870, partial [bacterium]|nr:hypothetical protein [bacterium]
PVDAAVCGSLQNYIGNLNEFRTGRGLRGVLLTANGRDPGDEQHGSIALAAMASRSVTHRTAWARVSWGDSLLDFWDDFSQDGQLDERDAEGIADPRASLAVGVRVPAKGERAVTFLLTWHFPNRMAWDAEEGRVGNFYTTQYADAWDAAERTARALPRLEAKTALFVRSVCESDLPHAVKDAALCNLTGLRSQTSFRTEDGRFYGWEGCHDKAGCCPGSCTHVWNYEQATAFLFGALARSMRETEFLIATADNGHMRFRVGLPLGQWRGSTLAAADGQMGCLMKLYRDWQLSGNDALLHRLWPRARAALAFAWVPGGWDGDRDGVMEGCQHNTMDVEYYGPNPQMAGWYLGALRAGEEMARYVGDAEFADTCRDLFERGSRWTDVHLFNDDYYEHEVRPPASADAIAPGLRHGSMGARDLAEPDLQLGAGCLVDQLVGQFMAHVCGLGYLLSRRNVRKTLRAIVRHNFQKGMHGHFNHMRTYALNDESALLMATYPRGRRPKRPFPYYNEVMTGFEYAAAVHMLYEGQTAAGLRCIEAIRARYDGRRRSPFDEAECGHHYARAMTSWGAVLALTGFHYSGVEQHVTFAAAEEKTDWFWSNGDAWGTVRQTPRQGRIDVSLTVLHGVLKVRRLTLHGAGSIELPRTKTIRAGKTERFVIRNS